MAGYVTVKEAARLTGISERTIRELIARRKLPTVREIEAGYITRMQHWIPIEALDQLRRSPPTVAPGDELATLRAEVADLRAQLAALQARPVPLPAVNHLRDVPSIEPSESPLERARGQVDVTVRPVPVGSAYWCDAADDHKIPKRTVENAINRGDITAVRPREGQKGWKMPSGQVTRMILGPKGLRQLRELFGPGGRLEHDDYRDCPRCPHPDPPPARDPDAVTVKLAAAGSRAR